MHTGATALYRHFDSDDVLLYVGISLSPIYRLSDHASGSGWAAKIARVSIEWYETRPEALQAELYAIATEGPKHNIVGRARPAQPPPKPIPAVTAPEYVYQPEAVAAHFSVSLRTITASVKDGMPREQIGPRKYRFDLAACRAWARANAEREALERIKAKREAASELQEIMADAMEKAIGKIGAKDLS